MADIPFGKVYLIDEDGTVGKTTKEMREDSFGKMEYPGGGPRRLVPAGCMDFRMRMGCLIQDWYALQTGFPHPRMIL
jgi:hypothetical protein